MRWFERRMQFSPPDAADRGGCQMRRALASPVGFRVTSVEPSTALASCKIPPICERQLENIVCRGRRVPVTRLADGRRSGQRRSRRERSCTVFVSRRLLDCLDRDETQGVIGHLLAEIANGAFHGPDLEPPRSVSGLLAPHPVRSRAIHCFCHSCACRLTDGDRGACFSKGFV